MKGYFGEKYFNADEPKELTSYYVLYRVFDSNNVVIKEFLVISRILFFLSGELVSTRHFLSPENKIKSWELF